MKLCPLQLWRQTTAIISSCGFLRTVLRDSSNSKMQWICTSQNTTSHAVHKKKHIFSGPKTDSECPCSLLFVPRLLKKHIHTQTNKKQKAKIVNTTGVSLQLLTSRQTTHILNTTPSEEQKHFLFKTLSTILHTACSNNKATMKKDTPMQNHPSAVHTPSQTLRRQAYFSP